MAFDTLQKSRLNLKILTTTFILTDKKLYGKLPKIPAIYYKLMLHVPLSFTFTILMWMEVVTSSDLNQATDVLYIALTETGLVVKILSIWYYDGLVKSLFNEWQRNEMFMLKTTQECIMWQRTMKVFGVVSFLYITCAISCVSFAFVAVPFLDRYQLPFPCWTPFNWENPSNYWYAYVYELLAMPLTCISNSCVDLLMCYMMQHLALQYKLISMRLENLGYKKRGTNADITKKLVKLIKVHFKLKSMSRSCEAIVSYPLLVQILLSALVLCFSLYRLKNFNILEDPVNLLSLVQYAVVMTMQVFLFCFYGSKLTTESSLALNGIYNCNWPEMSTFNRRIVLICMQYLQKPVIIKAGNLFNVDLATFKKTINNAYSFFALLMNMDNK